MGRKAKPASEEKQKLAYVGIATCGVFILAYILDEHVGGFGLWVLLGLIVVVLRAKSMFSGKSPSKTK